MNDHDSLIAICEHLGLKAVPNDQPEHYPDLDDGEYLATPRVVAIGAGTGYRGFMAIFEFDEGGRATSHKVIE